MKNKILLILIISIFICLPVKALENSTNLIELRVANAPFAFNPDIKEYNIKVPYDVNEVYVIAKSKDETTFITGDGLIKLDKGNNDITVKVTNENDFSNYIIHIKRSYDLLYSRLMIIILIVFILIMFIVLKIQSNKAIKKVIAEKNKIIAEENRKSINKIENAPVVNNVINKEISSNEINQQLDNSNLEEKNEPHFLNLSTQENVAQPIIKENEDK